MRASSSASEMILDEEFCLLIEAKSVSALIPPCESIISCRVEILLAEERGSFILAHVLAKTAGPI